MDLMVRSTGAAAGGGAGCGVDVAGVVGCCAWAAWAASNGAADPPSTVPTRNRPPARRLKVVVVLEITRPRLLCSWCNGALRRKAPVIVPARTYLANQALEAP